jgi:hypothetical protein
LQVWGQRLRRQAIAAGRLLGDSGEKARRAKKEPRRTAA